MTGMPEVLPRHGIGQECAESRLPQGTAGAKATVGLKGQERRRAPGQPPLKGKRPHPPARRPTRASARRRLRKKKRADRIGQPASGAMRRQGSDPFEYRRSGGKDPPARADCNGVRAEAAQSQPARRAGAGQAQTGRHWSPAPAGRPRRQANPGPGDVAGSVLANQGRVTVGAGSNADPHFVLGSAQCRID